MISGIIFLLFICGVAMVVLWYIQNDAAGDRERTKGLFAIRHLENKPDDEKNSGPGRKAPRRRRRG